MSSEIKEKVKLQSSVYFLKNGRKKMEDKHTMIDDLNFFGIKSTNQYSYYAVFDGHVGDQASTYASEQLHLNLINNDYFESGDVKTAFKEAFLATDAQYLTKCVTEGKKGGSTALCCLIENNKKVYFAWLGDSLGFIVKNGNRVNSMLPHKPNRSDERKRIENQGGEVSYNECWRVNGILAVSRAIGDPDFKSLISSEPDVEEFTLDGTEDFIILACDGFWDHLSLEEAISLVYHYLAEKCNVDADEIVINCSKMLVERARDAGSLDNITTIVIFLRDIKDIQKALNDRKVNQNVILFNEDNNLSKMEFPSLYNTNGLLSTESGYENKIVPDQQEINQVQGINEQIGNNLNENFFHKLNPFAENFDFKQKVQNETDSELFGCGHKDFYDNPGSDSNLAVNLESSQNEPAFSCFSQNLDQDLLSNDIKNHSPTIQVSDLLSSQEAKKNESTINFDQVEQMKNLNKNYEEKDKLKSDELSLNVAQKENQPSNPVSLSSFTMPQESSFNFEHTVNSPDFYVSEMSSKNNLPVPFTQSSSDPEAFVCDDFTCLPSKNPEPNVCFTNQNLFDSNSLSSLSNVPVACTSPSSLIQESDAPFNESLSPNESHNNSQILLDSTNQMVSQNNSDTFASLTEASSLVSSEINYPSLLTFQNQETEKKFEVSNNEAKASDSALTDSSKTEISGDKDNALNCASPSVVADEFEFFTNYKSGNIIDNQAKEKPQSKNLVVSPKDTSESMADIIANAANMSLSNQLPAQNSATLESNKKKISVENKLNKKVHNNNLPSKPKPLISKPRISLSSAQLKVTSTKTSTTTAGTKVVKEVSKKSLSTMASKTAKVSLSKPSNTMPPKINLSTARRIALATSHASTSTTTTATTTSTLSKTLKKPASVGTTGSTIKRIGNTSATRTLPVKSAPATTFSSKTQKLTTDTSNSLTSKAVSKTHSNTARRVTSFDSSVSASRPTSSRTSISGVSSATLPIKRISLGTNVATNKPPFRTTTPSTLLSNARTSTNRSNVKPNAMNDEVKSEPKKSVTSLSKVKT